MAPRAELVSTGRRGLVGALVGVVALGGCASGDDATPTRADWSPDATEESIGALALDAEPEAGRKRLVSAGTNTVRLRTGKEALVRVPDGYDPARPTPMALLLHGAGGGARAGLDLLAGRPDAAGVLLVAPTSEGSTWDGVLGRPGPDADAIDGLLAEVFDRYAVDPAAVAVGGFSDGASYALGLGLANGDLFPHVVAFSPGFVAGYERAGRPRLFVSHGTGDRVLPIERCGRPIARRARDQGYDVTYREFEGGHEVPEDVRGAAVRWLLDEGG